MDFFGYNAFHRKLCPGELKAQFRELNLKDIVRFDNLLANGPGDIGYKVPAISFVIR